MTLSRVPIVLAETGAWRTEAEQRNRVRVLDPRHQIWLIREIHLQDQQQQEIICIDAQHRSRPEESVA